MSPRRFFTILAQVGLAGVVLLLSHYGYLWVAAVSVLAEPAYRWVRSGRNPRALALASPAVIIGLSVVILIGLSKPPVGAAVFPVSTQIILAMLYAIWLLWRRLARREKPSLALAVLQQVASSTAIFLAAAFWHWPESLVVALIWVTSLAGAWWYLSLAGERAALLLASTWGLVAAEIAWILYSWQVDYILPGEAFLVPQATLVLLGAGYCFANIYGSHREKRLSRRRLIEYVVIVGVLLVILVAGTRWNGTA